MSLADNTFNDPAATATDERADNSRPPSSAFSGIVARAAFRPSMQWSRPAFYPDIVAQVYPWLADVSGPGQDPRQAWRQWRRMFGAGWIERRYDTNPWGLVALAAEKLGDTKSAACWTVAIRFAAWR